MTIERNEMNTLVAIGFVIWLVATVAFRLVGHFLLNPDNEPFIAAVFMVTIPAMVLLTLGIFRWRKIPSASKPIAASLLVLPGMSLDAIVLPLFESVYPNMAPESTGYFGGFLLLAYAVVLVVGVRENT
ncbi:hypothetical protein SAMN05421858_1984 [Haladaptatus litoreus]|uniref:Uncharacterized protein n=1 Tax=Haladaptatus litoreus TaxID=553468 RepID=A0A1N6ZDI2_9EURY|nr:DUF5367 family protein [Haladaptatus litoreus]SIR24847.1 hypothetical protein SAMN05421858_1984 [Haladaptatus litoreus]